MNKKIIALLTAVVAVGSFVLFFQFAPAAQAEVVEFSAILPLTGPLSHLGDNERIGMELALSDIKAKGEPSISFRFEDSQGKGPNAVTALRKQWDVDGRRFFIVATTGPALATLPIFKDAKEEKLVISQTMYPDITKGYPFAFRLFASSRQEAQLLANHAARNGHKRAAILHIQNEWGTESASIFRAAYEASGGTVVAKETYTFADKDYRIILAKLAAGKPDVLLIYAYPDNFPTIMKQFSEMGQSVPILANSDFAIGTLLKDIPPTVLATTVFPAPRYLYDSSKSAISKFNEHVQATGHTPNFDIATFYDMTMILNKAVATAKNTSPAAVREALSAVFPYDGVTGHMELTPDRELIVDFALSKWVNGKLELLK